MTEVVGHAPPPARAADLSIPASPMNSPRRDAILFTLSDRLLVDTVDAIRQRLDALLRPDEVQVLVLDMVQVRLCDSSGLRLLLSVQRDADRLAKRVVLYRPERVMRDLLDTTRLSQVFAIVNNLDSELQSRLGG